MHTSRRKEASGEDSCEACRERRSQKSSTWREAHSTGTPLLDRVADHAAGLPEEQRAVLLLVCVEGFTYRQAADVIGLPVATVMSLVAQARVWLMRRLADEASDLANVHPMVPKCHG
jgi:RNA polymerase sigma-70 factor (ECF subfamily)